MFLAAGAIWTVYATMVMTGSWEPRFQDFFAPLIILALLFMGIRAIGRSDTVWFFVAAAGFANAFLGQRIGLPPELAERLRPTSPMAWRAHGTHLALCLLAVSGAITTLLGVLGEAGKLLLLSLLVFGELLGTWYHFQWWRAAFYGDDPVEPSNSSR